MCRAGAGYPRKRPTQSWRLVTPLGLERPKSHSRAYDSTSAAGDECHPSPCGDGAGCCADSPPRREHRACGTRVLRRPGDSRPRRRPFLFGVLQPHCMRIDDQLHGDRQKRWHSRGGHRVVGRLGGNDSNRPAGWSSGRKVGRDLVSFYWELRHRGPLLPNVECRTGANDRVRIVRALERSNQCIAAP